MSILQYGFMQRAFLVGILLAVITPCIGITIVLKRMSMIGDALSHSSLAGVVLGLILGVNPVAGAVVMCIVAALGIEAIRKKIPRYSEVAISIVMSAGIGLAGVLSGFVENGASLNSFLFGSIVSISRGEMLAVCIISVAVLLVLGGRRNGDIGGVGAGREKSGHGDDNEFLHDASPSHDYLAMMLWAAMRPKTMPSRTELPPRRVTPWTPPVISPPA